MTDETLTPEEIEAAFSEPFWTIEQTLCWLVLRTKESIANSDYLSSHTHLTLDLLQTYDRQAGEELPCDEFSCSQEAEDALVKALKQGNIDCYGIPCGNKTRAKIPPEQWFDLKICYEQKGRRTSYYYAHPHGSFAYKGGRWDTLTFPADQVRDLWPASARKATRPRGREKGSGQIDDADALKHMRRLIESGTAKSVNDAANKIVIDMGIKGASHDADVRRLRRKHKQESTNDVGH